MEEQVVQALFNCTQAEASLRTSSESFLDSLKSSPGFGVLLLQISHNLSHSIPVRQLSAIYLKNQVRKWKDSSLHAEDKEFLKNNVIQCLKLSVPEEIRSQYEEISAIIGKQEKSWESLVSQIHSYLDSEDSDMVYAAISILNQFSKQYEYVITDKRNNLKFLMHQFFPKLEKLFERLLREANNSVYPYINLILQVYWVSFYIELSPEQATEQNLDLWLEKFKVVLMVEFDEYVPSDHYDKENKSKDPKLQCKKWASQIVYRFFSRYHDFKAQLETNKIIGQVFTAKWVQIFLDIIISQVFEYPRKFIPDLILNYYIKYINQSIKYEHTCEYVKGLSIGTRGLVIPLLITDIITPILCKTPYDEELWNDNPIEYIRKEADLSQTYYSPSSASIDLLETICERGYLQQFLLYLNTSLSNSPNVLTTEALIYEVGSLSDTVRKHENLANQVQEMLFRYVFPEFSNKIGFLRARACWAYAQFASFPFTSPVHQQSVLEKICALVLDPDLPVKYEAALALPKVLSWEISKTRVGSEIANVLKIYLDLINEIDAEEIIEALEDIVSGYSNEVLPFAIELCEQLSETFKRLASKEHISEEEDSAMAAVSVLNTINKIIETVSSNHSEMVKISVIVMPILQYSLSKEGSAYMEEGLNILSSLLYYAKEGSLSNLFPLCALVIQSLSDADPYGIEKTEEIFPVLANFVAKYPALFVPELSQVISFLLGLLKNDVNLAVLVGKLFIVLFENFNNQLQSFYSEIFSKLFSVVNASDSHKIKAICCQVIYVALWADSYSTISVLDSLNIFKPIFNYSLNNLKYIKEDISKTQIVIGLSNVFPHVFSFPNSLSIENSIQIFKKFVEMIILLENISYEEEEGKENASPFVDAEEFNERAQEIISKLKENMQENSFDEEEALYETDADEFYDSKFEGINYKEIVKGNFKSIPSELSERLLSEIDAEQRGLLLKIFN